MSLAKVSGANNWDAGAVSTQTLSGDGYVEFTGGATGNWRMCGLGNADSSTSYTDIEYASILKAAGISTFTSRETIAATLALTRALIC